MSCTGSRVAESFRRQHAAAQDLSVTDRHAGVAYRSLFFQRPLNGAGHYRSQVAVEKVENVCRRTPLPEVKQSLSSAEAVQELPILVHQEARRHVPIEQLVIDAQELSIGRSWTNMAEKRRAPADGRFSCDRHFQRLQQTHIPPLAVNFRVLVHHIELVSALRYLLQHQNVEKISARREAEMEER